MVIEPMPTESALRTGRRLTNIGRLSAVEFRSLRLIVFSHLPDARLEYKLGAEAIGGLKFVKEHNFVHGWFYVRSNNYSAL